MTPERKTAVWTRALPGLGAALLALALPAAAGAGNLTPGFDRALAACQADPANRIGGAAIGECLLGHAAALEREIAEAVTHAAAKFCQPAEHDGVLAGQATWEALRDAECARITEAPGNTPSYINGASCRFLLAEQRLAAVRFTEEYAQPRCPGFRITAAASRRGIPEPGVAVPIPGSPYSWRLEAGIWGGVLGITGADGAAVVEAELECDFCDGEDDNCGADGIFVMQEPDIPDRPAVFAVCHKGAHSQRVTVFDPVRASGPVLEVTGDYTVEWVVDRLLTITPDGDRSRVVAWPDW